MTAPRTVGLAACAALVVANMVGTGIFTSLGFQVGDIPSRPAIMILWSLGGILALCGGCCLRLRARLDDLLAEGR